jgi:hypothetical protein
MALKLYRRHRTECEGGHPDDTRSGEFDEGAEAGRNAPASFMCPAHSAENSTASRPANPIGTKQRLFLRHGKRLIPGIASPSSSPYRNRETSISTQTNRSDSLRRENRRWTNEQSFGVLTEPRAQWSILNADRSAEAERLIPPLRPTQPRRF